MLTVVHVISALALCYILLRRLLQGSNYVIYDDICMFCRVFAVQCGHMAPVCLTDAFGTDAVCVCVCVCVLPFLMDLLYR